MMEYTTWNEEVLRSALEQISLEVRLWDSGSPPLKSDFCNNLLVMRRLQRLFDEAMWKCEKNYPCMKGKPSYAP